MPNKIRYENPPIVERIVGVYGQIPKEEFEKRLPSWADKIHPHFPVQEDVAEWMIDIGEKNGVPIVSSLVPKASIIHLYWQKHPKNHHVCGMRIRPDRLVFHLNREGKIAHDFDELMPHMERWLPQWAEHFGVNEFSGITVEYVNILDGNITPQFADQNGVRIAEALNVFAKFPGSHMGITNPYDCKVRLVIDKDKPIYFDVRVGSNDRSAAAIRVDFAVRTGFAPSKKLNFADAIKEINVGHDLILEQFSGFFSEQAKVSFQPI
jgi:hypothetical protein